MPRYTVSCPGKASRVVDSKAEALQLARKLANETGQDAYVTPGEILSQRDFDLKYWGVDWPTVPTSTRREFYSDYRESGQSFNAYKRSTTRQNPADDTPVEAEGAGGCRDRAGKFVPRPWCIPEPTEPPTRILDAQSGKLLYRRGFTGSRDEAVRTAKRLREAGYPRVQVTQGMYAPGQILFGLYTRGRAKPAKPAKGKGKHARSNPRPTAIQTLLFDRSAFQPSQAKAWAKKHGYRSTGLDVTENYTRIRQVDPDRFQRDSFRTIDLTDGVRAVVGRPR